MSNNLLKLMFFMSHAMYIINICKTLIHKHSVWLFLLISRSYCIDAAMELQIKANSVNEKKYTVFESCLRSLLVVFSICLGVCKVAVKQV